MAISYVGGQVASRLGSTSSTAVTFSLTGGSNSTPQAGDLVIVCSAVGSQARNAAQAITTPTGYTPLGQLNPTAATYDTSMNVSWKFMGSTPDTTVTIPSTGNNADAQSYTIQVFRGVSQVTPMDVTPVSATGSGTNNRPDPGQITPTTSGAWIVICGAGAATGVTALTAPTDFGTNFLATASADDTNDCVVGSGYYTGWTSGAYNPGAYGGGTVAATTSWAAYTLALRPANPSVTVSPTSATIGTAQTTTITANVTEYSAAVSSATVTASSSATSVADAYPYTTLNTSNASTFLQGMTDTASGTSPSGASVRQAREDTSTTFHQFWTGSLTGLVAGDKIVAEVELKQAGTIPAVSLAFYSSTDGVTGAYAALYFDDGQVASSVTHGTLTTHLSASAGSGWYRMVAVYTIAATADGTVSFAFQTHSAETATPDSHAGNTSNGFDLGRAYFYKASSTTTDASGNASIVVVGKTAGSANVTATALGTTSSNSAITVSNSSTQTLTHTRFTNTSVFRQPTVTGTGPQTLTHTRFTNTSTFGTATVKGRNALLASLYANTSTFGTAAVKGRNVLTQQRIVGAQAFGQQTVRGRNTVTQQRLVNTSTFGNASVRARYTLTAQPVTNASTFGSPTLTARYTLGAQRIVNASTFGTPTVTTAAGLQTLTATRLLNTSTFGVHTVTQSSGTQTLTATLLANTATFGNATLRARYTLTAGLFANDSTFGNHTVTAPGTKQTLGASLIVNDSTFGAHTVTGGATDEPATRKTGGGGGVAPRGRRFRVQIDDQVFWVETAAEAAMLLQQAAMLAEQTAREKARELANREKVRLRAARRAAPVVRIEAPEPVPEVAAIQRQVEDVNAKIRAIYEDSLRAELIARYIQRRIEDDEDEAILALLT